VRQHRKALSRHELLRKDARKVTQREIQSPIERKVSRVFGKTKSALSLGWVQELGSSYVGYSDREVSLEWNTPPTEAARPFQVPGLRSEFAMDFDPNAPRKVKEFEVIENTCDLELPNSADDVTLRMICFLS
jgi:hypothetical protein